MKNMLCVIALLAVALAAQSERHTYYGIDIETGLKHGRYITEINNPDVTGTRRYNNPLYKSCTDEERADDIYCEKSLYEEDKNVSKNANNKPNKGESQDVEFGVEYRKGNSNKAKFSDKNVKIDSKNEKITEKIYDFWIVILAGIVIVCIMVFSGKKKKTK